MFKLVIFKRKQKKKPHSVFVGLGGGGGGGWEVGEVFRKDYATYV